MTDTHAAVRLEDYTPPPWLIDSVRLDVDVRAGETIVGARIECTRNVDYPDALKAEGAPPLVLDGEELETLYVAIDGKELPGSAYRIDGDRLTVDGVPASFVLETRVRIRPDANTRLSGFYRSRDGYFTQCEPEGFRRITWFIDRPDVMARYTVTLHADKTAFPVLLSNGNPVAGGIDADGRRFATWEDPFRKPSYLFAMVAAKLDALRDVFTTASGRKVALAIYVEPGKLDQCGHAMAALKKAMRWDEERFGLECDLDHYTIVAVGDFNMGAMENKGLNVFNTRYVLARADLATDADFENIDRVVAHEYFHNWTGNRVTCRDWFQLSLKEGLTVFRDQEFGADTHGRETARLADTRVLRAVQFSEDAGPMAHPVRPESYVEINNFYTATVYEKGAEVVRMIQTLIGRDAFRRGMEIYFERHDGQAVTCDDFVAAMAAASGFDFGRFMTWYRQAGTPKLRASGEYDARAKRYVLTLAQSCDPTPGQTEKEATLIPVALGLVGPDGRDFDLSEKLPGKNLPEETTRVLHLTEAEQRFVFENIPAQPTPSILRGFSAPVKLDIEYSEAELAQLFAHDSDPFNRWEAGQRLFTRVILGNAARHASGDAVEATDGVVEAARKLLRGKNSASFIAEALTLPGAATLAEEMARVDPEALHTARQGLAQALAAGLETDFAETYARLAPKGAYRLDAADVARRRLRNLCLAYLNELDAPEYRRLAAAQFESADNMTDQLSALACLVNAPCGSEEDEEAKGAKKGRIGAEGEKALEAFYARWAREDLVVDKWLSIQAACRLDGTLDRVESLTRHAAFDARNPNKIYALLRTFGANHRHFNAEDGRGYRFLAAWIAKIDPANPQVAARLARSFDGWRKFSAAHQAHARSAIESLRVRDGLSKDVSEVVAKLLG
ncbi:MAG: aminopeptidase N [Candidatus Accumulibacter sp.]|jgi:aminopeptidase N|nr:aminopeptidase N [Accumulibacter sp.]